MALTPLLVNSQISFTVSDGTIQLFKSGNIIKNDAGSYTQSFGDDFTIPDTTVDLQVTTEGVALCQLVFLLADQPLQVKLVPVGATAINTQPLTLTAGVPSLLAVQDLVGIYVSNASGTAAKLIVEGVGVGA